MKFRRILATVLSVIMTASAFVFTASADSTVIAAHSHDKTYVAERQQKNAKIYEEASDLVFSRMYPSTSEANAAKSCYINISGQTVVPTAEQIADDTVYAIFYVRTNMELDDNDNPSLSIYNAYWGPDSIKKDGSATLISGNSNFITKVGTEWGKLCFKLKTRLTVDGEELPITKWTQFALLAVGTATTNPIQDWAAKAPEGETPYMDCAGYAVVSTIEAAEDFDFAEFAKAPKVSVYFDAQTAEDDSDVTSTQYVTGKYKTGTIEFPTPAAPSSDVVFAGWSTTTDASGIVDTSAGIAVPSEDATFYAIWKENVTEYYVNGSAATNGDGLSADTPFTSLADAWNALAGMDGTIYITGETKLQGTLAANGGNITIKGVTGEEVLVHSGPKFNGTNPGRITFENITLHNKTQWGNFWNFYGQEVEFGENITVPVDKDNSLWPVVARAGGESGGTLGRKIVIKSGTFATFHLGSKGNVVNADVDFEFLGGTGGINLGNDSVANQAVATHGGTMSNIKALFDAQPNSVIMQWIHTMTGALQLIANNGVDLGEVKLNGVVPKGGIYRINSAEGGRVDFTDTIGTFAVTTDAKYIVVTNKATGESEKIRVADGVKGEANLFGEGYTLVLEAGEYDVDYTNDDVKITVKFVTDEAAETYTIAKGETATFAGTVTAPAGKAHTGWTTEDGAVAFDGNSYTADTYFEDALIFVPVFGEDNTLPYYRFYGEYDTVNKKYSLEVTIANGQFTAGTIGINYNSTVMELTDTVFGDGVAANLGDAPEIMENIATDGTYNAIVVWNATEGYIDASNEEAVLFTLNFDITDFENFLSALETASLPYGNILPLDSANTSFVKVYENYYDGTNYLVSPRYESGDPYVVEYVPVYFGKIINTEKTYEKAEITFNVIFASKVGATVANVGELVVVDANSNETSFVIDPAGNTEATVTQVVDTFMDGDSFSFYIHKNGYIAYDSEILTVTDGDTYNITLVAGDIKDSSEICCGDGEVTLADFVRLVRAFDQNSSETYKSLVDLDESGAVNVTDLGILKANFGKKGYAD